LRDSKLLKVIKDKKLLPESKLRQALEYKKKLGPEAKLADVMLKLGLVDEKQVSELVAESESIHVIDIGKHSVDFEALDKLPRKLIEKHVVVPLADEKGKILLAMAEPVDLETLDEIQFITNCLVETVLAPRNDIKKAIEEAYSLSPHERKARAREVAHAVPAAPKPLPKSPYLAEVLTEILVERGLVTKEEIIARLKAREL
jgi:type IV pilus assembly protein PilB